MVIEWQPVNLYTHGDGTLECLLPTDLDLRFAEQHINCLESDLVIREKDLEDLKKELEPTLLAKVPTMERIVQSTKFDLETARIRLDQLTKVRSEYLGHKDTKKNSYSIGIPDFEGWLRAEEGAQEYSPQTGGFILSNSKHMRSLLYGNVRKDDEPLSNEQIRGLKKTIAQKLYDTILAISNPDPTMIPFWTSRYQKSSPETSV